MADGVNWEKLPLYMRESLDMTASKIGRILSGDFMEPDHWLDMSKYDELVLRELEKQK